MVTNNFSSITDVYHIKWMKSVLIVNIYPKNYGKVGPQILLSDRSIDFLFILA